MQLKKKVKREKVQVMHIWMKSLPPLTQCHPKEDEGGEDAVNGRLRKTGSVEEHVDLTRVVQLWELERHSLVHVLVESAEGEDRHGGVDHVVEGHEELVEHRLS